MSGMRSSNGDCFAHFDTVMAMASTAVLCLIRPQIFIVQVQIVFEPSIGTILNETLSRARFDELNRDNAQRILASIENAILEFGAVACSISHVVFTGAAMRTPMLRKLIKQYFSKCQKPPDILSGIPPEEVVAIGAAIQVCVCSIHCAGC